jgi:ferrochelatase
VTTDHDYDALLVVSFGGPEGPADVDSFLDNVFRGLRVPPETKEHIAKRYEQVGGVSPINAHTRAFIKALQLELDAHGPALPIYWGNRNWHPLLADTVAQMAHAGVRRALAFVTSTFSSYSGCRRYREDLFEAASVLPNAPLFDKLRVPYNHPGFIAAMSDRVTEALDTLPAEKRRHALVLFTAHSLPLAMAQGCEYEAQLAASCALVGDALELPRWRLTYQSNNASYGREAWLGPDIRDALREAEAEGIKAVVVAPIGFVCDHMEVVMDLDVDAAAVARELGVTMARAGTVGTHPAYVAMVR